MKHIILFILSTMPFMLFSQNQQELEGKWVLERAEVINLYLETNKTDRVVYLPSTSNNTIGENYFNQSILKSLTIYSIDNVVHNEMERNRLESHFIDFIAHIQISGDKITIIDERSIGEVTEMENPYEYTYQIVNNKLLLTKDSVQFKNELGQRVEQSLKIYLVKQ